MFMGAFTLFGMGILNEFIKMEHNDPFWIRSLASCSILILLLLSFAKRFKQYHTTFLYIVLYIGSTWAIYMIYENNFFNRYTTIVYVLTFISLFIFERIRPYLFYIGYFLIGAEISFLFLPDKSEEAYSFIYFYPFVTLAVFYGNYYLITRKEQLTESVQLFESLINSTIESYIMVDKDYKIVQLNDKAKQGFREFSSDEVFVGKSILDFSSKHRDNASYLIDLAFENELHVYDFELPFLNGIKLYFESRYLPVLVNGDVKYCAISSLDVTEKRLAEREIVEAKEKAEAANLAKTEFLSVMSHEIRTPMNAVIGMTHLLKDENPTPKQLEHINTLQFSADNLLVIINDILDYNKIEAGKIEFEYRTISLKEKIQKVLSSFKMKAIDKAIELKSEFVGDLPEFVKADSTRLAQILVNLTGNAVKFTSKGFIKIRVSVLKTEDELCHLKFEVIDTGVGIAAENHTKIFESFSQETNSTTREFGGTGLGLTITKKLLQLQDSDINLESEKGKGSNFWFVLKLEVVHNEDVQKEVYLSSSEGSLKGKRILLVEDNSINQLVAKNFLDKWEVSTVIASNGLEAIEKLKVGYYDIVLMDLQMPVMDGFEATRQIREFEDVEKRNIPIVALTASALLEVQNQVKEASMNGFVAKPFNPDDLYSKIAVHLV